MPLTREILKQLQDTVSKSCLELLTNNPLKQSSQTGNGKSLN